MKIRIGEYLVERGIITQEELELALHRQLIYGGRIGTNIIKLGLITEDVLISLLQVIKNTKGINLRKIGDLSKSVINALSREDAIKCKCVPFEVSGSRIKLACIDVLSPEEIKYLENNTGKSITTYIFPEIQWVDFIKEYYEYDPTVHEDIMRRREDSPERETATVIPLTEGNEFQQDELESLLMEFNPNLGLKTSKAFSDLNEIENYLQKDAKLFDEKKDLEDTDISEYDIMEMLSDEEDYFTEYKHSTEWKRPRVVEPDRDKIEPISLAEATLMLARATNREQVIITLLTMACNYVDDAALFFVKPDKVTGWRGLGKNVRKDKISEFTYSLLSDSMFFDIIKNGSVYHGPVVISANNRTIFRVLDLPWPHEICLMPIVVRKRIVALMLLSNRLEPITTQAKVNIELLVRKAEITFEILVLKMKNKKDI
jgi:hypothetical protein